MEKLKLESPDLTAQNHRSHRHPFPELRDGNAGRGTQHEGEEGIQTRHQF